MNQPTPNTRAILESAAFKKLVRQRWSFSLVLTLAMLVVYFGFLLVVAFNKELLATKIGAYTTLAIPVGLGIILFAWLLTGVYVFWANTSYDASVEELKKKVS